jgi:glycosyltransferase involved in cell wall biosynthesis
MWHFARQAALAVPELGVDAVLGFGRTVAQDVHRAGGGCHGVYSRLLPFWKRYGLKNLLELHLERQLYQGGKTRHFVTNSRQVTGELLAAYGGVAERFTTIHTAVESTLFCPAEDRPALRDVVCRELATDPKAKILLFVSLSHKRKGLDALIEALARLPEAMLWVVGKPPGRRYLETLKRYGLERRVRLVPVSNSLVRLYQVADWFVHPTRYDACANTVLQSMACGLPGVISARDGAVDHVKDGETGFLLTEPEAAEAVADVLRRALAVEESQRLQMAECCRAQVAPLTWEAHVGHWEDLLSRLS